MLLNLATAQELAGRPRDAIHSLGLYNERMPGSTYQEPNRRRIERLQHSLPAPSAASADPPPPAASPAASSPASSAANAVPIVVVSAAATAPVTPVDSARQLPAQPASAAESRSLLPLGVAAVGAAASLIGGVVYGGAVVSSGSAAERCGGPRSACVDPDAVAAGEAARARAQTAGWITTLGVATALGGVVWYLVQPSNPARTTSGWHWDAHVGQSSGRLSATRCF